MKKILLSTFLILIVAVVGVAQQKPPAKAAAAKPTAVAPQQNPPAPQAGENFVVGVDDVLSVMVWKEDAHSAPQVVVRPDGKITLPMVGDLQASGLTTKMLEVAYSEQLKPFFQAPPTVTVTVLRIESRKVFIVGAVFKSGAYTYGSPMTVLELIARAGGLLDYAKVKSIKILRKKDGQTLNFNYKEVISGKNLKQNIILENGDTVMVPD